jgi:uncharacterized repeat protein (TIGR03803 family)
MKTNLRTFVLLVIGLTLGTTDAFAQKYTVLHTFNGWPSDGNVPVGRLQLAGNTLYGTTFDGGTNGIENNNGGIVFSVNTDGTGYTILHSFSPFYEGDNPNGGLALSGHTLYGVTEQGGQPSGRGTLFSINTDGSGFNVMHNFSPADGGENYPWSDLLLSGDTLYGNTANGWIYSMNTNGVFSLLGDSFGPSDGDGESDYGLILVDNILYGVTEEGGTNGVGVIFAVGTNGLPPAYGFPYFYSFGPGLSSSGGSQPSGRLVLGGNTLYGTAGGGTNGYGIIFSIQTVGNNFTILHSFGQVTNNQILGGTYPGWGLVLAGDTLYGVANGGGLWSAGTIFSIHPDGSDFTVLHAFDGGAEGGGPWGGIILSGCTFYGTCSGSIGSAGYGGTVFSLAIVPGVSNCSLAGTNLILNATNGVANCSYVTVTSTNLTLPVSQWLPLSTNVLTQAGNFTVTITNAIDPSISQRFYSLLAQ